MSDKSNFLSLFTLAIGGYVLLILGHGYVFGHLGTMETFPYVKKLLDPTLYPHDFYIDGIQSHFPDVRWIFVQMLKILGIHSGWTAFIAHFLVTLFLILGLLKVALIFTSNKTSAFLATMMTLLILYNHNLGGNELYYNNLAPSLVAKSIGVWSVYWLLKKRIHRAILLLIPTTFIHPMVGVQLFLLETSAWWLASLQKTKNPFPWKAVVLYVLTSGAWIIFLQRSFSDSTVASAKIFEILEFRLGHHYFPADYPLKDYGLLVPYFLFGWWFLGKQNRLIFWFYAVVALGLVVYSVGVELAQIPAILSAQWFKTTIWLKFFSSIALFVFIEKKLLSKVDFLRKLYTPMTGFVFVGLGIFLFLKLPQRQPTTLDLPWRGAYNDRIKMALFAKAKTPKDALFITPSDFTHLKYYGERSTYVDYKATIHFRSKLVEWYHRIHDIYRQTTSANNSNTRLIQHHFAPSPKQIKHFKTLGITHIITTSQLDHNEKFIGKIGDYWLYAL
ncbi:MAG TPA: hypothetical protein ENK85_05400 [Saprospiraceae bacterium]|nr:hypothetical protein [Saprospiraceae bacterium]